MERAMSIQNRLAGMIVALALLVVGAGFMVLGVSFLPVIGLLVGVPIMWLGWRFLSPKAMLNERAAGFVVPNDVMFHAGHGWARIGRSDTFTVGMDDFAVKLIGSVDSISLPEEGSKVKQGSPGWQIKTENREINMLSPVEGEIVEINRKVISSPEPWLLTILTGRAGFSESPTAIHPPHLANMIPEATVGKWLESIRETLFGRRLDAAAIGLLQDGGEPVSGLAKAIDPQRWDELAREFLLTK